MSDEKDPAGQTKPEGEQKQPDERLRAAELENAKLKLEKDLADTRKKLAQMEGKLGAHDELTKNLRKLAGVDDGADPSTALREREEQARKAERERLEAEKGSLEFEGRFARSLFSGGLLPKDNDLEYVLYKIGKDAELAEQKADLSKLTEALVKRGLLVPLAGQESTSKTAGGRAALPAPARGGGSAGGQSAIPPELAAIKSLSDFTSLPFAKQTEYKTSFPDYVASLRDAARLRHAALR